MQRFLNDVSETLSRIDLSQATLPLSRLESCNIYGFLSNRDRRPSGERHVVQQSSMEVYIKAGPSGEVGDCPFAHFVRCVLNFKGLEYKTFPCKKDTKPAWLLSEMNGKMPCLKNGDFKITESMDIVKHIEKTYPEPSLTIDNLDQCLEQASKIFPAFAKLMKDPEFDQEKENALMDVLISFEAFLKADSYLGPKISIADYSLAPKLLHLDLVTKEFSPKTREKIRQSCPKLENFMKIMFADEAFESARPDDNVVIWGWTEARKPGADH